MAKPEPSAQSPQAHVILTAFEIACITVSLSDEGGTRGSHPC
jgi:hypothetical protein